MAKLTESKFTVSGKSGKKYEFDIYSTDTNFNKVGGIYIFTKRQVASGKATHDFIYCGKTDDLSTRFDSHHKADCMKRNGANCICIKLVGTETERTAIETDILLGNNFSCNEKLN